MEIDGTTRTIKWAADCLLHRLLLAVLILCSGPAGEQGQRVVGWGVGFGAVAETPDGPAEIADYAGRTWIVNSRNTADEDAVRTLASLVGFVPRIAHEIDSLELVEDLILAGYGVGLLPIGRPSCAGVKVLPLAEPKAILTAYAVTRRGRATWPPLRTVLDRMRPAHGSELPHP